MTTAQTPIGINLHTRSRELTLTYADGETFSLPCEYLRVYSPSAEVMGHGPGQEVLQTGKMRVNIQAINPVGNYALQLVFDDGHDTGLYSWDYLYTLCTEQDKKWQAYLDRLTAAGATRDPDVQVLNL
ncbi:MAG: gamma-butyrobetaine hydroxylase-like domain-containing protein [Halioglobus sp.]